MAAPLLALVVLAVSLSGGGDDGRDGPDAASTGKPAASVSRYVPVEREPKAVAVGHDAVWVASIDEGKVTRLDPATGDRIGEPLDVDAPISYIATDDRYVWVTSLPSSDGVRGEVARIDPSDNTVVPPRIPLRGTPLGIAIDAGAVWIADYDGRILRIDAATARVTDSVRLPARPRTLAIASGALWVPDRDAGVVLLIDVQSRRKLSETVTIGQEPSAVVAGGGFVWVTDAARDTVTRIDPAKREVVGEPIRVGRQPAEIAYADGSVWVVNERRETVTRIDARTGRVVGRPVPVGRSPGGLAAGAGKVWVPNADDDTVAVLTPTR